MLTAKFACRYYGRPFEARNKVRSTFEPQTDPHAYSPVSFRLQGFGGPTEPMGMVQAKGGSFVGDNKDFFRFRLGEHTVIPAFEEAVQSMKVSSGPLPLQWFFPLSRSSADMST